MPVPAGPLPVYATGADYAAWIAPAAVGDGSEITRLLARASELLDAEVLNYCSYPTDSSGLPTDDVHVVALRDATCSQVAWWEETGDDQGTASQYSNVRIGDVALSRGGAGGPGGKAPPRVAPHAVTILRRARLLPPFPVVVG